jgi:succinate dehydrogenase/fumarate reductase flavoprotein subunit
MMTSHDAIIIGTGAAGGIVAGVLTEAGKDDQTRKYAESVFLTYAKT